MGQAVRRRLRGDGGRVVVELGELGGLELGGVGVPQPVGVDALVDAGLGGKAVQQVADVATPAHPARPTATATARPQAGGPAAESR
jgi:hypothetical protein